MAIDYQALAAELTAGHPTTGAYQTDRNRTNVLITPYDSITQVARKHYPWLPVRWLLKHHFDSASLAPNLTPPALFLLADRDTIIPVAHSEALAALWGGPLELRRFPEATHNSIGISHEFKNYIQEFLKQF